VRVATADGEALVVDGSDVLVARVAELPGGAKVVQRFQAVGATRPVEFDAAEMRLLVEVVKAWMVEVGAAGLPEGLAELANELWMPTRAIPRTSRLEFNARTARGFGRDRGGYGRTARTSSRRPKVPAKKGGTE
jgi:hypothetical protein